MALNFTTQKNGLSAENIGHKASGDPLMCPEFALLWHILHLRTNNLSPSTNLSRVMMPTGQRENIMPTIISKTLNASIKLCVSNLVFEVKDVSAQFLCTASTMALLCTGKNSDIIKLIGCWHSDEMLCYLQVQA